MLLTVEQFDNQCLSRILKWFVLEDIFYHEIFFQANAGAEIYVKSTLEQ